VIEDAAKLWEAEERWLTEHFGKPYCYNAGRSPDAPMRGRFGESNPKYQVPIKEAQKAAISATLKAFYAEDPNNHPRLGKVHSDETKEKISAKVQQAVAEGRGGAFIPSEETRRKISENAKKRPEHMAKMWEAARVACEKRKLLAMKTPLKDEE